MQNMYEQFYRFIARLIIDFLKSKNVKAGEKLELKLTSKEEIEAFNKVLAKESESEKFIYQTPQSVYETVCLRINGIKIIIASDVNHVKPSFLASLRNLVGTEDPLFKDAGVLFVHNSSLDTLISGADKLQKEGMPLHYKNIDRHIKVLLQSEDIQEETKAIVEFMLSRQSKFALSAAQYLAEYREIIQVLAKGRVEPKQYEAFGLFYDSTLKTLSPRDARQRLEENAKYYAIAHNYHELNTEDSVIQKDFDQKGIQQITSPDWKTLDYKVLKASLDKQKNSTPIEYIEEEKICTSDGLTYWERPSSDTAAGRRIRHIIIFNPNENDESVMEFKFSQNLKKTQAEVVKGSKADVVVKGNKLQVTLFNEKGQISYNRIKYKDKKNYEFRILVVPFDEEYFNDFKIYYTLPSKIKEKGIILQRDEASFQLGGNREKIECIELKDFQTSIHLEQLEKGYIIKSELDNPEGIAFKVDLKIKEVHLPIQLTGEAVKPKPISMVKVERLKRERGVSFTYSYNEETQGFKLFMGTEQYFVQEELLKQLTMERNMLANPACAYQISMQGIKSLDLELDESLKACYFELINYYQTYDLLPSLAHVTATLEGLMRNFLRRYVEVLEDIAMGTSLGQKEKNLIKLGQVEALDFDRVMWSPLHPLNIAYMLQKYEVLKDECIEDELLKQLLPIHLVPCIKGEEQKVYTSVEEGAGSWIYFEILKDGQLSSTEDLAKIVSKTIHSFKNNFRYIFFIHHYPIKINAINVEGQEVIGGILRYLYDQHKNEVEYITPIEINHYKTVVGRSLFYEVGHEDKILEELIKKYLPAVKTKEYEIYIKLFRKYVTIYQIEDEGYREAHINFISTHAKGELTYRNTMEVQSALMLEGLAGGFTAYTEASHYIQTLGLKGMMMNPLLNIVKGLNAIAHIGNSSNPYEPDAAIALATPQEQLKQFEEAEKYSDWTVYIEPKAEYKYFTKKEECLIHYVDRLYSAHIIDALTLSKKYKLYTDAILQKIQNLHITVKEELQPYIEIANILNGEWLVEVLAFKKNVAIESIHTVALVKWIKQYLDPTYQYWVPVSIHEFLRTCEGTGIYASKGLFSIKNYERYLNDLLWIGYRLDGTQVDVAIYPMSVGLNKPGESLYKLIKPVITEETFEAKYFRQLLLQKGIINGELLEQKGFFEVPFELDDTIRAKLINGQYHMTLDYKGVQEYEMQVVLKDDYVSEIVRSEGQFVIKTNLEAIWLEALGQQKIQVTLPQIIEDEKEEDIAEELMSQQESEIEPVIESDDIELPIAARYSIIYYIEELNKEALCSLDCYIAQGIKGYILVNASEEAFIQVAGQAYEHYEYLKQHQILTFLYDVNLGTEIEEPYIADGKIDESELYKEILKTTFNYEQYEIEHAPLENNMVIKAGAGTGKTKVMIDRIMFIKHMQPAISLEDIVMITFTNESTMEMRTRLANRLAAYYQMTKDKMYLDWMDELAHMQISTIHAFAKNMIGLLGEELGISDLSVTGYKYKKVQLIEEAINDLSVMYPTEYNTFKWIKHYELTKMILAISDYLDNRGIALATEHYTIDFGDASANTQFFFKYVVEKVAKDLESIKKETGAYEINDLIKKLRELKEVKQLKNNCHIAYLMVDEFQDTDEVQVDFIAWLTNQVQNNLFVVGDTKQSIYRFRGADYTAFEQLDERLEVPIHTKNLVKNYRSDHKLVEELNKLFQDITRWVEKFEFEEHDALEATKNMDGALAIQNPKLKHDEDKFALVKMLYHKHKTDGSVCVLVRTNKQVRQLTQMLEVLKVPVIAKVKGHYYTTPAVRDFYLLVRALLHPERLGEWMLLEQSPYGKAQWSEREVLAKYSPNEQFLLKFLKESTWYQTLLDYSKACRYVFVLQVIKKIIDHYKPHREYAKRYYKSMKGEHNEDKSLKHIALHKGKEYEANLNKLFYILQSHFTDEQISLHEIETFLRIKIATDRDEEEVVLEEEGELQALRIMTVHQSKGLEFDTVLIPYTKQAFESNQRNECIVKVADEGYQLGYSLHSEARSFENNYYSELYQEEQLEIVGEETRLFYVACTRAKSSLYIFTDLFASSHSKVENWQDLIVKR